MDVEVFLRGDQIGRYASLSATGNNQDRVVTLNGVEALGTADDTFRVLVEQVNNGVTEFQNGQFVTVFDADGAVVVPRTGINPDAEQGQAGGDEHLIITQQPFVIDLNGVPAGPAVVQYGQADQIGDPNFSDNDGELDFVDFPCLAVGTLVETACGLRPAEDLRRGDVVPTPGGARKVIWTGRRQVTLPAIALRKKPVIFPRAALGALGPHRDLIVSPQHRMLMTGPRVAELCGAAAVLAPARGLTPLPCVRVMRGKRVIEYVTILLDRHAVMWAEGVLTESFYPGPEGLRMLGPDLARAVFAVLPALATQGVAAYGPPAAPLLTMRQARRLARRIRADRLDAKASLTLRPASAI